MPIDITREVTFPLSSLAKKLPYRRTYKTMSRWCCIGVKVPTGRKRIKLEYVIVGGKRYTSIEAYSRFVELCTKHDIEFVNSKELERQKSSARNERN